MAVNSVSGFAQALVSPYLRTDPTQGSGSTQGNDNSSGKSTQTASADTGGAQGSGSSARAGRGSLVNITV